MLDREDYNVLVDILEKDLGQEHLTLSDIPNDSEKEAKQEIEISDIKTRCCKSTWTRVSRAKYLCDKCKKDNTLYIVLVTQCLDSDLDLTVSISQCLEE